MPAPIFFVQAARDLEIASYPFSAIMIVPFLC